MALTPSPKSLREERRDHIPLDRNDVSGEGRGGGWRVMVCSH
jgi:hypothetical protein